MLKINRILIVAFFMISNQSQINAQSNPEKDYPIQMGLFCKSKYAGMVYPCYPCKQVLWRGGAQDDNLVQALIDNGINCSDGYWDPEGYSHIILKACEKDPSANTVKVIDQIIENFKNKYTSKAKCLEQ